MLKNFIRNARKPVGVGGSIILWTMNWGHGYLVRWGFPYLNISPSSHILDIGCGGGANIHRLLQRNVGGKVYGVDYSALCVQKSKQYNAKAIAENRCEIKEGSVSAIPYSDNMFDIATAIETVYMWPDFKNDLKEVLRIIKSGGTFFICNECVREDGEKSNYKVIEQILESKVYSPNEYKEFLTEAGFVNVQIILSKNKKRICVIAQKQ